MRIFQFYRGEPQHFPEAVIVGESHIGVIIIVSPSFVFLQLYTVQGTVRAAILVTKGLQVGIQPGIDRVGPVLIDGIYMEILYVGFPLQYLKLLPEIVGCIAAEDQNVKGPFLL